MEKTFDSALVQRYREYETQRDIPSVYSHPDSIDAWRVAYPRRMLVPWLRTIGRSRWLTVGDGYFGSDAHFLLRHGIKATASSLSADMLQSANKFDWIDDWQVENAEAISTTDRYFDYVLCMETLQHCEAPERALREILRVANDGTVIMTCIKRKGRVLDLLREYFRTKLLGRQNQGVERYGPTGGKLTRLDRAQICAAAKAMGFNSCATREFNMLPLGSMWDRPARASNPIFIAFRVGTVLCDLICRVGLMTPSFSWFILFRDPPNSLHTESLASTRFEVETI